MKNEAWVFALQAKADVSIWNRPRSSCFPAKYQLRADIAQFADNLILIGKLFRKRA